MKPCLRSGAARAAPNPSAEMADVQPLAGGQGYRQNQPTYPVASARLYSGTGATLIGHQESTCAASGSAIWSLPAQVEVHGTRETRRTTAGQKPAHVPLTTGCTSVSPIELPSRQQYGTEPS